MSGSDPSYSEMMEHLTPQAQEILAQLPLGSEFRKSVSGDAFTFITEKPAVDFALEDDKRRWIAETMNTYVNAIRPRVKNLEKS
jgi:hypothetical protein